MPGPQELILILIIILVIFGATKLPALGKGLGQGIRNFKKGLGEEPKDANNASEEPENG